MLNSMLQRMLKTVLKKWELRDVLVAIARHSWNQDGGCPILANRGLQSLIQLARYATANIAARNSGSISPVIPIDYPRLAALEYRSRSDRTTSLMESAICSRCFR